MTWLKANWKKLAIGTVAAAAALGAGGYLPAPVVKAVGGFVSAILGAP